jgi:hypothetical protein
VITRIIPVKEFSDTVETQTGDLQHTKQNINLHFSASLRQFNTYFLLITYEIAEKKQDTCLLDLLSLIPRITLLQKVMSHELLNKLFHVL